MDAGFLDGVAKFEIYNPKRPVGVLQVVKYVQTRPGGPTLLHSIIAQLRGGYCTYSSSPSDG